MVSSSSDYSSSSSEEDSRTYDAKDRASIDRALLENSRSLDKLKSDREEILKRKENKEILAEYRKKRRRIEWKRQRAEERLRSRPYGVASDSDAEDEEEELVWDSTTRKDRSYPPHMNIERHVRADIQAERDDEDLQDAIEGDDEEEEFFDSDNDSEKEYEEDPSDDEKDDDDDEDGDADDSD